MRGRVRVVSVLSGLAVLGTSAVGMAASPAAAATGPAFAAVADLSFHATSVQSTASGGAYAAGVSGGTARVVLVGADGTQTPVAVTAQGARVQLTQHPQDPTAAYLLVTGSGPASLWRLSGTTASRIPIPATTPTSGLAFTPVNVGGDDTASGLWLAGTYPDPANGTSHVALRYDQSTSTWSEYTGSRSVGDLYPVSGIGEGIFQYTVGAMPYRYPGLLTTQHAQLAGGSFQGVSSTNTAQLPNTDGIAWRVPADYTVLPGTIYPGVAKAFSEWGAKGAPGTPETGFCDLTSCTAPAYPVSAATRLADGRVVVGGRNTAADGTTAATTAAPAGFGITGTDQLGMTALGGTVGNIVDDLSAAPTGTVVWAVTFDGSTSHVQRADVDATAPTVPTPPVGHVPAGTAFTTVASPGYTATDLVAPTDGVAYVAGVDAGHAVHVDKVLPDGTTQPVAITATGTRADLVAAGGHVGLLVTGGDEATLWEIVGTTAYRAWLATSPDGSTNFFRPVAIAADSPNSVYVTAAEWLPGASAPTPNAMHWNGSTWEQVGPMEPLTRQYGKPTQVAYAADSRLFHLTDQSGPRYPYTQVVLRSPSATAVPEPDAGWTNQGAQGSLPAWTLASSTDYTMWGSATTYTGNTTTGSCEHVVGTTAITTTTTTGAAGSTTTSFPCVAPTWAVSAATRLADGRTVLGGDTRTNAAAPGFALVQGDGATPVAIPGIVGTTTTALAAEPTGGGVWALTSDGSGSHVQHLDLGALASTGTAAPAAVAAARATSDPSLATSKAGFLPNSPTR